MSVAHTFKIGDIVALGSHPYFESVTEILISGDHLTISPLMVIAEVLNDAKTAFDEVTGTQISDKNHGQCKCIWYSSKSGQFEESWLSTKHLKLIEGSGSSEDQVVDTSMRVALKTISLEMKKQKSSLSIDGNGMAKKNNNTISPLLSFISPIMQVVEVKKNEEKDTKYDIKTGNKRKFVTKTNVKCKWYNPVSEKMSEKILPIEILKQVVNVDEKFIKELLRLIGTKTFYEVEIDGFITLLKPLNIVYKGGLYLLRGYDYIDNIIKEMEIGVPEKFKANNRPILDTKPSFDDLSLPKLGEIATNEVRDTIFDASTRRNYLRMTYRNRNEKVDTRTISKYELQGDEHGAVAFVKGYCHLRKEERTFRLENIQNLQVLNLSFP